MTVRDCGIAQNTVCLPTGKIDMPPLLFCCAFCTFAMTGLIWLVQLVHYPLMANVGPAQFVQYEKAHCQKITPIVFPLMMLELISSIWIAFRPPVASPFSASAGLWNSLALATILIWLSTALVQVPLHRKLENGFESGVHRRLVRSNWLRTLLWSVRSAGLGWILLG